MKNALSFGIVWLGLAVSSTVMAAMPGQDFKNITAALIEKESVEIIVVGGLVITCGILQGALIARSLYYHAKIKDSNGKEKGFKETLLKDLPNSLLMPRTNYGLKAAFLSIPVGLIAGMYFIKKGLDRATTAEKIRGLIKEAQVD